jgi:chitinase
MAPVLLFSVLVLAGSILAHPYPHPQGVSIYFDVPVPTPIQPPLVMGYYPDWASPSFPPSKIDFKKVDIVDFAFSVPDENFNLTWDDADSAPSLLSGLIACAHSEGKKVKLSIGGWSGSKYFSPAVQSNSSRNIFTQNILSLYHSYSLDGIDIDWEYPGTEGEPGNIVSTNDTENFLEFLGTLRGALPEGALLTATSTDSTLANSWGNPSVDMSAFAALVDWILIMNYDVNGGRFLSLS